MRRAFPSPRVRTPRVRLTEKMRFWRLIFPACSRTAQILQVTARIRFARTSVKLSQKSLELASRAIFNPLANFDARISVSTRSDRENEILAINFSRVFRTEKMRFWRLIFPTCSPKLALQVRHRSHLCQRPLKSRRSFTFFSPSENCEYSNKFEATRKKEREFLKTFYNFTQRRGSGGSPRIFKN